MPMLTTNPKANPRLVQPAIELSCVLHLKILLVHNAIDEVRENHDGAPPTSWSLESRLCRDVLGGSLGAM